MPKVAVVGRKIAGAACILATLAVAWIGIRHFPELPGTSSAIPDHAGSPSAAGARSREDRLTSRPAAGDCPIRFVEVTDQSGITFQHVDGSSGMHYPLEPMSTGLATFDFDGDGLIDIYFPNGAALPGAKYGRPPRHALYRNLGGWRFEEVTDHAGLACEAYGMGIAIGDYDGDGWPDIYLDNFGPNLLYHNNGDGTFTDVTLRAGVEGKTPCGALAKKVGAGACFLDIDGDGLLDLYAGNYVELDLPAHVVRRHLGFAVYPSPLAYAPIPGTLYRNRGDGTFSDVSGPSGIAARRGRAMGTIAADYNADGATDLFICNDVMENFLFRNKGRGQFEEVALTAGVAMNGNSETVANMAVDCGDYDNDGRLDFYVTDYQGQLPLMLRGLGDELFEDVAQTTRAGAGGYQHVKWGCGLVDLDNDGFKDLFVALGHIDDNIEHLDMTTAYRTHNLVLRNTGRGTFVDVSDQCGIRDIAVHAARGVAFDDLDNDGDLDAVVLNSRERPTLLRNMLNEQGGKNHWLQVRLQGVKTNRDGVGARVRVVAGDLVQIDEVHSGRSYQSHYGTRLHFGLGPHARVDRLEVHWIGGGTDVLENLGVDRLATIVEGASRSAN